MLRIAVYNLSTFQVIPGFGSTLKAKTSVPDCKNVFESMIHISELLIRIQKANWLRTHRIRNAAFKAF
jgi:hypothetical protein